MMEVQTRVGECAADRTVQYKTLLNNSFKNVATLRIVWNDNTVTCTMKLTADYN
jgi:hypothetical protein